MGTSARTRPRDTLAEAFDPRANALNTLRLVLAAAVMLSHAALLGGFELPRPVMTMLGEGAVDGFFALSGFLLARSWLANPQWGRYLWRRFLRILPAFWVCLAVTALVTVPLVLAVSGFPMRDYWSDPAGPWGYLWRNAALWMGQPGIAGTPSAVAYPGTWNGSLWTLFWEFLCYLALLLLGLAGVLRRRYLVLAVAALLWALTAAKTLLPGLEDAYFDSFLGHVAPRLLLMFAVGATLYLFADVLPMHPLFAGAALLLLLAALNSGVDYRMLGGPAWAFLLLWLGTRLRTRIGSRTDISYGVYIYAFPIQQSLAVTGVAAIGWLGSAALAMVLTLPFAFASWFVVERPAMRWKSAAVPVVRWRDPVLGFVLVAVFGGLYALQVLRPGGY